MADKKITIEIGERHTFRYNADVNPEGNLAKIFDHSYVVEERGDGALTLHPVSRVTAVYVGDVPARRIGFPTVPSAR